MGGEVGLAVEPQIGKLSAYDNELIGSATRSCRAVACCIASFVDGQGHLGVEPSWLRMKTDWSNALGLMQPFQAGLLKSVWTLDSGLEAVRGLCRFATLRVMFYPARYLRRCRSRRRY